MNLESGMPFLPGPLTNALLGGGALLSAGRPHAVLPDTPLQEQTDPVLRKLGHQRHP